MCLLYSEPGAGSDLAGLQTRADRDGDEWVVNGQKVWTSSGKEAEFGMLVARTNWDVPKHQGISFFWCPMRQPGVDVRPIRQITGESPLQRGVPRRRAGARRPPRRAARRRLAGAADRAGLRALGDGRPGPRAAQRQAAPDADRPTARPPRRAEAAGDADVEPRRQASVGPAGRRGRPVGAGPGDGPGRGPDDPPGDRQGPRAAHGQPVERAARQGPARAGLVVADPVARQAGDVAASSTRAPTCSG